MPLFLNDDQYEIMLIPAAAEAPGICPRGTPGLDVILVSPKVFPQGIHQF